MSRLLLMECSWMAMLQEEMGRYVGQAEVISMPLSLPVPMGQLNFLLLQ